MVDGILTGESTYLNIEGNATQKSLADVLRDKAHAEDKVQAYPKKWIWDCWADERGRTVPDGFKSQWSFAQAIFDLCKLKCLSPVVVLPQIPLNPRSGTRGWVNGAKKFLERRETDETFDQWMERIKV